MTPDEDRSPIDWEIRFRDNDTPWERATVHPAFAAWEASGAFIADERVVVPGCGRSPEVLAFAKAGLTAAGIDLSPTAIDWQTDQFATAKQRARLIAGDVLAWTPPEPVDLVYDQTFLCAIHPRLRSDYETTLVRWLKPGGRMLALFMQKDERGGPPYGCPLDVMRDLFSDMRWRWPEPETISTWPHPQLNGKPELSAVLVKR
ncbi:thiopurine S-methyltransferase [Maricaulis sp. W15]|uniref:methyltransferase domain-containing protein n=1 Tax=Maricaulis sp. W15 TaxID=1772333 RepID=UPI000948B619|nr:methyltransferase domain-containing protein [Maricaulis sp. W15]OLF73079.1 thiopurine S-methyltransferase [Maricaulis sp. W15]